MAKLKFKKYYFNSFQFEENDNFDSDIEQLDVDFFPTAEVNILESENIALVSLDASLGDEKKSSCPFTGKISLTGIFEVEFDEKDTKDQKLAEEFLTQNTIAILFPYLRSFISDMTLRTNKFPVFILPPFNVIKMMEDGKSVTINHLKKENE